jgi:ribosomal protein L11 methyltransferase
MTGRSTLYFVVQFIVAVNAFKAPTLGSPQGLRFNALTRFSSKSHDSALETEATLRSITFCNLPKEDDPDLLCDFLMEIGACSTAITDADRGTDMEQPVFSEPGADPWQDRLQWTAPVWNRCNVTAHFPASAQIDGVLEMVAETFPNQYPDLQDFVLETLPNRDWVVHVQKGWLPIVVNDKFVLRFPWHKHSDVQKVAWNLNSNDFFELELQGGIAFGTGEHPTTQLCLAWVDQVITDKLEQSNGKIHLLDYGSGSGVLGMAACILAPHQVAAIGIDIDVDACRIANANALKNDVKMRSYLPPLVESADETSKSLLLKAHKSAREHVAEQDGDHSANLDSLFLPSDLEETKYDVCVANILAAPLVTLAPVLYSMLLPGAVLGMSGILPDQGDMVVEAYTKAGFASMTIQKEQGNWLLVTGNKPIM